MKTALRSKILGGLSMFLTLSAWGQTNAWINEIHYDNASTDANEAIELVIESPGALSDYEIYLYRDDGTYYESVALDDSSVQKGTSEGNFSFFTWRPSSIQNGDADGIALAYQEILISGQLLSYEGTFIASDGPANGATSIDIGVSEDGETLSSESLQLSGAGLLYADFSWEEAAASTFGTINTGQTFGKVENSAPVILQITQSPAAENVTPADSVSVSAQVTDDHAVEAVYLNWGVASGILTDSIPMSLTGGNTYTTEKYIPSQPNNSSVYYQIIAIDNDTIPLKTSSSERSYVSQVALEAPALIISEIASPSDDPNASFIEIYNKGTEPINFDETRVVLAKFTDTIDSAAIEKRLIGILAPGDFYVVANDSAHFSNNYGITANLNADSLISANGADSFALIVGGNQATGLVFDVYGKIGMDGSGEAWEFENARAVRNSLTSAPTTEWRAAHWTITAATTEEITPGNGEYTVFTYDGNSWFPENPNGNATAADHIIVESGVGVFTENISVNNITIQAGATLKIQQVLSFYGTIVNDGELVFISDSLHLGQLAEVSTTSSISGTGEVTVERYLPADRAFRMMSVSVNTTTSIHANWQEGATSNTDNPNPGFGTHITGATVDQENGFDKTTSGNPSLFIFDNKQAQAWSRIDNTDTIALAAGKAYRLFVRGDRSIDLSNENSTPTNTRLRASGSLVTGKYIDSTLSEVAGGFSFVGNPYRAVVDMNKVLENSTNLNTNYFYIWDPTMNNRGAYVPISLPSGINYLNESVHKLLYPGQAVFVSTLKDGKASMLFEEKDKAAFYWSNKKMSKKTEVDQVVHLNLRWYKAGTTPKLDSPIDGFQINFSEQASNAVLSNDAIKLSNFDENVAVVKENDTHLSIENRALPVDGEVVQLFNNQYRHTNYTYRITLSGLDDQTMVYLKDDYLRSRTILKNNGVTLVDFSVDETIPESMESDRFALVFDRDDLSVEENQVVDFMLFPNPTKKGVFFIRIPPNSITTEKMELAIFNILGQEVYRSMKQVPASHKIKINTTELNAGMYILKITLKEKTFSKKIIIQ